jgi:hypothetical protein
MGFSLDLVELFERKMGSRQSIIDTEPIDSPVESLDFSAGEMAAVNDFGKVVAFFLQYGSLLLLISDTFVCTQILRSSIVSPLLDC